jgi:hypothetical protein
MGFFRNLFRSFLRLRYHHRRAASHKDLCFATHGAPGHGYRDHGSQNHDAAQERAQTTQGCHSIEQTRLSQEGEPEFRKGGFRASHDDSKESTRSGRGFWRLGRKGHRYSESKANPIGPTSVPHCRGCSKKCPLTAMRCDGKKGRRGNN